MISVIIPYINEYDYLQEALASALGQTDVELEIIAVCNDASSPDPLSDLRMVSENVRFIHEPRAGSAYARNAGLQLAQGDWVQFLDVDDLLLPEKIYHQTSFSQADVVLSPHTYQFLSGKQVPSKWIVDDLWTGLLNSGLGSTSSMLWRREALFEVNGWNPGFSSHQEYELLFRLFVAGKKIMAFDRRETIVRQRPQGSITENTKPIRAIEGIRLREAMWQHLEMTDKDTEARYEAFRQYIFKQLRGYFRRQPASSLHLYRKYFSTTPFTPKDMHIPGYGLLYGMLGFEKTEKILRMFSGWVKT